MDNIENILMEFTLSEILEHCDISEEEVLEILIKGGYIELPPFLEHLSIKEETRDSIEDIS